MGKKKHKHPEHVNHERWLVSYADFITLLFAFFVVLFSSSQVDRSKSNKMSLSIQAAFSSFSIFKERAGKMSVFSSEESGGSGEDGEAGKGRSYILSKVELPDKAEGIETLLIEPKIEYLDEGFVTAAVGDNSLNENLGYLTTEEQALAKAQRDIMALLDKKKFKGTVEVNQNEKGVTLTMRDIGGFDSGTDGLSPESRELLYGIGYILSLIPNQIRLEGHTDDKPPPDKKFATNWELSTWRATALVRWFAETFKMDPKRFVAVGYGEYRPVADNSTEEGRKINRRVDIMILSDQAVKDQGYSPVIPNHVPMKVQMPKHVSESVGENNHLPEPVPEHSSEHH